MENKEMERDAVVRRWKTACQQKKEATAWMKQTLTEMYEKEYGRKPQGIEVW